MDEASRHLIPARPDSILLAARSNCALCVLVETPIRIYSQREQLRLGNSTRRVSLYSLKERGEPNDTIIYCSDGQGTVEFAQQFYDAFAADSFWFVGVDSSPEFRNSEYVIGQDHSRFDAHETFFVHDVVKWATHVTRIKHGTSRSAVFGYSCGGAFAASIGIRHPDVFGTIFCFSIAGRPITNFDKRLDMDLSNVSFYLRSGSREPKGMRNYMKRLQKYLRLSNAQVDNATHSGEHDLALWTHSLNETMSMAFELDA